MSSGKHFLEQEKYCRDQAAAASSRELKAEWLLLAAMWADVAKEHELAGPALGSSPNSYRDGIAASFRQS